MSEAFLSKLISVALFTRAWIEMTALSENLYSARVALFTRAWIEMTQKGKIDVDILVALFTRAWIEIHFVP